MFNINRKSSRYENRLRGLSNIVSLQHRVEIDEIMGLEPLEFAECLTDSPSFREKLHDHEKELERTNKAIKSLVNDGKELVTAAKRKTARS